MESKLKITANMDAHRPDTCRFTVAVPVYETGTVFFPDKEAASGSPLAERLFGIETVTRLRLSGSDVIITKSGEEPWRPLAGKVADAIRNHLDSGKPAVSKDYAASLLSDEEVKSKVQKIFDTEINPAVASHGGVVDLLDVKDNKVFLRMGGGCQGCGMADVTLRQGIEGAIRKALPQIDDILDVTDHASGTNPYYAPAKK